MEIRLSIGLLGLLLLLASALSAKAPKAVIDPVDPDTVALAALEDQLALERNNLELARRLTSTYLKMGRPGIAIAAVRTMPPEVARDPVLTHRLAQAYEASGRVDDALATAHLARARCMAQNKLSSGEGSCSASTMAVLDMHADALSMLKRWGVQDPKHDSRAALAYRLAQRTASIASLGLRVPMQ